MPIDMDPFMAQMRGRGLVEVLLRGHLWVEKFLSDLVEAELRDPEAIALERMPFAQKVNLAQALGLISRQDAVPMRTLNRMRNRLAHDLTGDPLPEDLALLEENLQGAPRGMFDAMLKHSPDERPERRLEYVVHSLIVELEMHRLHHVYERDNREALSTYRLISAMVDRLGRRPEQTDEALRADYGVPDPPVPWDVWVQPSTVKYDDLGQRLPEDTGETDSGDV